MYSKCMHDEEERIHHHGCCHFWTGSQQWGASPHWDSYLSSWTTKLFEQQRSCSIKQEQIKTAIRTKNSLITQVCHAWKSKNKLLLLLWCTRMQFLLVKVLKDKWFVKNSGINNTPLKPFPFFASNVKVSHLCPPNKKWRLCNEHDIAA